MRSGRLNKRLTIQQKAPGSPRQSASGERLDPWATFKTVRASIRPLNGRELRTADQAQSRVDTEIEIRYLEGVVAGMRGVHEGVAYTILAAVDPELRHKRLLLQCSAGVVNE